MTVAIAGIGELPHGKSVGQTAMERHEQLIKRALDDAGLKLSDVDAILTVAPRADSYLIHATAVAEYLNIRPAIAFTLEAGGPGPMAMVEMARGYIEGGSAKTVVIVAADMPLGGLTQNAYIHTLSEVGPVHPDLEVPFGPSVPSMFALVAQHHMHRYGLTQAEMGAVALQGRKGAQHHPNAMMRKPLTMEEYEQSPWIATPLKRLDCAPVCDGGGAAVITSLERAKDLPCKPVKVLGTGFSMGHMHLSASPDLTDFNSGPSLDQALAAAKLDRSAIDVGLIYDCFTIAMLINMEDLGLAPRGEAGRAFAAGAFAKGTKLPINPHGGLLSHGHPARGAGFGNLVEGVVQIRGEAGERQVPNAKIALAHGMGAVFATHGCLLLGEA